MTSERSIKRLQFEALKRTSAKTVQVVFSVPSHGNNALRDHFLHDIRLVRIVHQPDCAIVGKTEYFDHFGVKSSLSKKLCDLGQETGPISEVTGRGSFGSSCPLPLTGLMPLRERGRDQLYLTNFVVTSWHRRHSNVALS